MENEKTTFSNEDTDFEVLENVEDKKEETKVKSKWSLKKKLMIAGGVVTGLILGALVLGSGKKTTAAEQLAEGSDNETNDETDETEEVATDENIESDSEKSEEE